MLKKLEIELKIRGFTLKTIQAYLYHNQKFLNFIKKDATAITTDDIKSYLAFLMSEKKLKPSSICLIISALKFFYEEILKKKELFLDVKPPKLEKKLPEALTKEEVKILIDALENPKHKLLVEFMYASGLRVSECVNLKIGDLMLSEKIGIVRQGKGRKDRNIILSDRLVSHLKEYLTSRPNIQYIFPGISDNHITIRQAQKIVKKAALKGGIKKRVYCHILRSSFATHLLESGIDIRFIQELLGHSNISTTQRYTKVSTEQLKKIKSPLDSLSL